VRAMTGLDRRASCGASAGLPWIHHDIVVVVGDLGLPLCRYRHNGELRGMLWLADPLLGLAFRRIGDRAAAGLRRVLGNASEEVR